MSIRQEVQQELSRGNVDEEIIRLMLAALEGEDEIEKVPAREATEPSEYASGAEEQVLPIYHTGTRGGFTDFLHTTQKGENKLCLTKLM